MPGNPSKLQKFNPEVAPAAPPDDMPPDAGPWLQKCVGRWQLIAPFDKTIIDGHWEAYYKERAALDWYTNVANGFYSVFSDEVEWTEDFPQPEMESLDNRDHDMEDDTVQNHVKSFGKGLKETISGCPKLIKDVPDIGDKLAAGIYMLGGSTDWDGNCDCCDFNCETRLYSPYGLGTSVN
jgi:hypothetical protein